MINRNKFFLFLLFLLIIAVPVSFASDNITSEAVGDSDILETPIDYNMTMSASNDDEMIGAGDVYFDASASSGGDGSQSRPYNTVTSSYLGTTNHFAPGTYRISSSLSSYSSYDGMSFIGTDKDNTILQYVGSDTFITTSYSIAFKDITIKNGSISTSGGTLTATDTIFDSGVAKEETEDDNYKYGNSYGGAIKQAASTGIDWGSIFGGGSSSTSTMNFNNCIFRNNHAAYGGAIYSEKGTVTITNSRFENNYAENGGGAIAVLNGATLTVSNCEFENDRSLYDAGGAIYLFNVTKASVESSHFISCNASIGGAIASLISPVTVTGSNFNSNKASWIGGAVFAMYGSLSVKSSYFYENSARHGGAIYADNLTSLEVNGGTFQKNSADGLAGAIFAFTNKENKIINPTYASNTANEYGDLYQTDRISLNIGNDDYELIQYKSSYTGSLPSKYDLRTAGGVTPVKDQGQSGNCWAFATMATLESAILKATGKTVILSEGNLKNLANRYSDIGWDYETNNGGMYPFVYGYLTSWAGPVLASLDPTDDWDVIAPIINSAVHVQNILYLQRTSFTDNNAIKKAIMDYGAVCSEIYWSSSYLSGNNYYYNGDEGRNHAISVVGWDDTKSISGAPGAGAWIIKNSYGSHRGDGGYYYVSYYDKSLFRVYDESYNSFAVVFNDTLRFNKNYQYDAAFTDYFLTPTYNKVMWYKNTFTSTGNDILSAFSTYFRKVTNWEAQIFVNDELKTTQSGKANPGYWTINLNDQIPLKLGDTFTISLKISCTSSADIPISESGPAYTLVKQYFGPGVSFFSTDGVTWTDFCGYKSTFGSGDSGHNYFNQVACLKAFTTQGPQEFLNTTVEIVFANSTTVIVSVHDQRGGSVNTGEIELIIGGEKFTAAVSKAMATVSTYLKPGNHNIQVNYLKNSYYNSSSTSKTITLDKETPIITISASDIKYGQDLDVKVTVTNAIGEAVAVPITVEINGRKYTQGEFKVLGLMPNSYAINVQSQASDEFNAKLASKTIVVSKIKPAITLEISDVNVGEKINVKATLSEQINAIVKVNIDSNIYEISIVSGVGSISVDNALSAGQYIVTATFEENEYFLMSTESKSFNVKKLSPSLSVFGEDIVEGETAIIKVYLPNDIKDALRLTVNSKTYTSSPSNGEATFYVDGLGLGKYSYTVSFEGNSRYDAKSVSDSIEVLQKAKKYLDLKVSDSVMGDSVTVDVELPSDATGSVTINMNSLEFTKVPVNGKVSFKINGLEDGSYNYIVKFNGDSEYKSALIKKSITVSNKGSVKSTISAADSKRAYLSGNDFEATFTDGLGNLLSNQDVLFVINGNEYYAKTNQYGVAKISKNFAVGTFVVNVFNLVTGENATRNMTIVSRIAENKNINMDYSDGSNFKVRVYGDNAHVVGAGEKVTFKVDGKTYTVKTDKNGYATLKLDLTPKTYVITTSYRGVSVSNKIVVKQVLKAKNTKFKKSKKVKKFKATLKIKGKAIKGKKITFKVNGKTYMAKTNKKGVATVNIKNLKKVGKYKVTVEYLKTAIKKTITLKK